MPNDLTDASAHVVPGPEFVVPPRHRLYCVVASEHSAMQVVVALDASALSEEVWLYAGGEDAKKLDPGIWAHGPKFAPIRIVQRLLTSDCEYCAILSRALLDGHCVLAIGTEPPGVEALARQVEALGASKVAYGAHWDFVAVPHDDDVGPDEVAGPREAMRRAV